VEAAIAEFADKGFYSAHMEAIAGRAGVNKAMVYYYFGSKEKLLSEVLALIFNNLSRDMQKRFTSRHRLPANPIARIRLFVESHFDIFARHQNYARILVNILANHPDKIKSLFSSHSAINDIFTGVYQTLEEGRRQGLLRDIDYRQLLISILGMNLVYFVTKPVAQVFLQIDVVDERKFIRERRKFIVDLLLHGILKNTEPSKEEI
jgi:TetR/AcrR family transcriptional regulator